MGLSAVEQIITDTKTIAKGFEPTTAKLVNEYLTIEPNWPND